MASEGEREMSIDEDSSKSRESSPEPRRAVPTTLRTYYPSTSNNDFRVAALKTRPGQASISARPLANPPQTQPMMSDVTPAMRDFASNIYHQHTPSASTLQHVQAPRHTRVPRIPKHKRANPYPSRQPRYNGVDGPPAMDLLIREPPPGAVPRTIAEIDVLLARRKRGQEKRWGDEWYGLEAGVERKHPSRKAPKHYSAPLAAKSRSKKGFRFEVDGAKTATRPYPGAAPRQSSDDEDEEGSGTSVLPAGLFDTRSGQVSRSLEDVAEPQPAELQPTSPRSIASFIPRARSIISATERAPRVSDQSGLQTLQPSAEALDLRHVAAAPRRESQPEHATFYIADWDRDAGPNNGTVDGTVYAVRGENGMSGVYLTRERAEEEARRMRNPQMARFWSRMSANSWIAYEEPSPAQTRKDEAFIKKTREQVLRTGRMSKHQSRNCSRLSFSLLDAAPWDLTPPAPPPVESTASSSSISRGRNCDIALLASRLPAGFNLAANFAEAETILRKKDTARRLDKIKEAIRVIKREEAKEAGRSAAQAELQSRQAEHARISARDARNSDPTITVDDTPLSSEQETALELIEQAHVVSRTKGKAAATDTVLLTAEQDAFLGLFKRDVASNRCAADEIDDEFEWTNVHESMLLDIEETFAINQGLAHKHPVALELEQDSFDMDSDADLPTSESDADHNDNNIPLTQDERLVFADLTKISTSNWEHEDDNGEGDCDEWEETGMDDKPPGPVTEWNESGIWKELGTNGNVMVLDGDTHEHHDLRLSEATASSGSPVSLYSEVPSSPSERRAWTTDDDDLRDPLWAEPSDGIDDTRLWASSPPPVSNTSRRQFAARSSHARLSFSQPDDEDPDQFKIPLRSGASQGMKHDQSRSRIKLVASTRVSKKRKRELGDNVPANFTTSGMDDLVLRSLARARSSKQSSQRAAVVLGGIRRRGKPKR